MNPKRTTLKEVAQQRFEREKQINFEILKRCGVPEAHLAFTPAREGEWGEKLAWMESMFDSGFLVAIRGERGKGKTQMACELMKTRHAQEKTVKFTTLTQFLTELEEANYADNPDTENAVMSRHQQPSLLVIDEVDRRINNKDEASRFFYSLVNKRYGDMTATVLICDIPHKEKLNDILDTGIMERIYETGGFIECTWESFRK